MGGCSKLAQAKTIDELQKVIDSFVREARKKHLEIDNMTEVTFNKETGMYEQGIHFDTGSWG